MKKIIGFIAVICLSACSHNETQESTTGDRAPDSEATEAYTTAEAGAGAAAPVLAASTPIASSAYKSLMDSKQINPNALTNAFKFYEANKAKSKLCEGYMGIADYTKPEKEGRFYIANLKTGKVEDVLHVANSKNSGGITGGSAQSCGNVSGKIPCGFLKMENVYKNADYGLAMRISGLQPNNSNSGSRGLIAIGSPLLPHSADGKWVRAQYKAALAKGINSPEFQKFTADFQKGEVRGKENGKDVIKKFKPGINGQISFGGPTFDVAGILKAQKLQGCMFMNYFGEPANHVYTSSFSRPNK